MKEKRRRQGVPNAHVSATYKKITVNVPDAPVSDAIGLGKPTTKESSNLKCVQTTKRNHKK